jgi:hypothetical protein
MEDGPQNIKYNTKKLNIFRREVFYLNLNSKCISKCKVYLRV